MAKEIRKITEEEFKAYLEENYIAYKLWSREDIANELLEAGYADSEENIDEVLNAGVSGLDECSDGDWQIIQDAIFNAARDYELALSRDTIAEALESIKAYYSAEEIGPENLKELSNEKIFPDIRNIGLAYTDITQADVFDEGEIKRYAVPSEDANTEYPVQVSLDLPDRTLITTVNGVVVETVKHRTTRALLSYLGGMSFSSLVSFCDKTEEVKAKIAKAMQEPKVKEPAECNERLDRIQEATNLIRKAAELGILNMPDENHVWVAWEFEDGAEGWRKETLLSAAISLAKEKENMDLLKEKIQKKNEREDQQAENTPAEMLAKFIAANWHFCPIPEAVTVPNCQCWGSEMCAKCVMEHYDYFN